MSDAQKKLNPTHKLMAMREDGAGNGPMSPRRDDGSAQRSRTTPLDVSDVTDSLTTTLLQRSEELANEGKGECDRNATSTLNGEQVFPKRAIDLTLGQQVVVWGLRRMVHDRAGLHVSAEYDKVFGHEDGLTSTVALSVLLKSLGCTARQRAEIGGLSDDQITRSERVILRVLATAQNASEAGDGSTIHLLLADQVPLHIARVVSRNMEVLARCLLRAGFRLPQIAPSTPSTPTTSGTPATQAQKSDQYVVVSKQPTPGIAHSTARH